MPYKVEKFRSVFFCLFTTNGAKAGTVANIQSKMKHFNFYVGKKLVQQLSQKFWRNPMYTDFSGEHVVKSCKAETKLNAQSVVLCFF